MLILSIPEFGVCIRQNSIFAHTEHRYLIHMSPVVQLVGGEDNGRLLVIKNWY